MRTANIVFCLLVLVISPIGAAQRAIPELAKFGTIRVGAETIEQVERRLGRGQAVIGGHPRGGRLWLCRGATYSLYVDGFYRGEHGRVVDTVILEKEPDASNKIPVAVIPQRELRLLGAVSLGMTRAQALQALGSRLPSPKMEQDRLIWEQPSALGANHGRYRIKGWRAELRFKNDKAQAIYIEAAYT